ncbi:MAG: glutamate synthase central domain-containing protein, partial [Acidobacteriota bacterium]
MSMRGNPTKQGLYDPRFEHDACGVGFVVDMNGRRSHTILKQSIEVLNNLHHRGACGCEADTGDGAGILLQMPHRFFQDFRTKLAFRLPKPGAYGAGLVFLPTDPGTRYHFEWLFEQIVEEEGQSVLGWRTVPTNSTSLGLSAKASEPVIRQIFIGSDPDLRDPMAFERKLYVIRRRIENCIQSLCIPESGQFYVCSLSHRTLVYKGMLKSDQLVPFYPDLQNPSMETALAMVHSRFSTNTFPTWARAHPYRYLSHNGEINTLRGNINWMRARQSLFSSKKRNFYRYHSCLMEPWDGPASVAFTDGVRIGAVLDRNGLRPSRYYVTKDGLVIMASEVGVLPVAAEQVEYKGRLQPGRMLLVDTEEGRIVSDEEIKEMIACEQPYGEWVRRHQVALDDLPDPDFVHPVDAETVRRRQQVFGYTTEELKLILTPMALNGAEPVGSMGNDVSLAVLSDRPQLLFNYFKQLFAQVTNPPIDSIREEIIVSHDVTIGPERNLLEAEPQSARQILLGAPILSNEGLEKLRQLDGSLEGPDGVYGFRSRMLPTLFPASSGGGGLEDALEELCQQASRAIADGCEILILSDRGHDRERAPIPALLALSAVHHHLIREETRTRVGLLIESGEPREVHHFALLIGYGASAINPYLAFETLDDMIGQGLLPGIDHKTAVKTYIKAAIKGVVKVMSKMGIS